MSLKNSNDTSWEFFLLLSFFLRGFFRHNRARYSPTRLACGHKTWSKTVRVILKCWSRWMRLWFVLSGRCSYLLLPPRPLPGLWHHIMWSAIIWSCTFRHCSRNRHVVSSTVRKLAKLLRLLGNWYIFHSDRLRKSIRSCNIGLRIEPATFRFVTQHLNNCATAFPLTCSYGV